MEAPKSKSKAEDLYIFKRKIKAAANSLCFYICRIFPIKKNLISVCTFEGKGGFGCNPKYVVQELHRRNPDYEFVWFVNKNVWYKEFPDYIKKVPNTLLGRAYWLTRSKVWIDNYRKPYGTVKRKGQYYLNTNHYTIGIKSVGLWRGAGFSKMAYLVSKNDSDMIDDLIIDSKFGEEMCPKGLIYNGNYLKCGSPRCDVLYGDRQWAKDKFRRAYNLPDDAKVVMFAPTFREGAQNGVRSVFSQVWSIDFKRMLHNLEEKFGGVFYIAVRVHPQLEATFDDYENPEIQERLINISHYDDMYEILAGMDVYVTDYSSACFEAGFAKIPVFIYADDIQKYAGDRGSLFWNMTTDPLDHVGINQDITPGIDVLFPFPIATNNDELDCHIKGFEKEVYEKKLMELFSEIDLVFNGNASLISSDRIIENM